MFDLLCPSVMYCSYHTVYIDIDMHQWVITILRTTRELGLQGGWRGHSVHQNIINQKNDPVKKKNYTIEVL